MDDDTKKAALIITAIILVLTCIVMYMSIKFKPVGDAIESSIHADGLIQDN